MISFPLSWSERPMFYTFIVAAFTVTILNVLLLFVESFNIFHALFPSGPFVEQAGFDSKIFFGLKPVNRFKIHVSKIFKMHFHQFSYFFRSYIPIKSLDAIFIELAYIPFTKILLFDNFLRSAEWNMCIVNI